MKKAICLPDTLVKTKHYRGRWFFILMVLFDGIKIFKKQKKVKYCGGEEEIMVV